MVNKHMKFYILTVIFINHNVQCYRICKSMCVYVCVSVCVACTPVLVCAWCAV